MNFLKPLSTSRQEANAQVETSISLRLFQTPKTCTHVFGRASRQLDTNKTDGQTKTTRTNTHEQKHKHERTHTETNRNAPNTHTTRHTTHSLKMSQLWQAVGTQEKSRAQLFDAHIHMFAAAAPANLTQRNLHPCQILWSDEHVQQHDN